LTARFRRLRHSLASGPDAPEGLDDAGLEARIAAFPAGWARRRAVSAALAAGRPADLRRAAAWVSALDSPIARTWAWSALAEGRDIDPGELETLLAAEPDPTLRRRLQRRWQVGNPPAPLATRT
jgi:hypothetical protein